MDSKENDNKAENNTAPLNGKDSIDLNKFKSKSSNLYAKVLYYIGWGTVILGTIGSINLASEAYNGTIFLIGFLTSLISGFLILGISEIINILDENRKLLSSMMSNDVNSSDK